MKALAGLLLLLTPLLAASGPTQADVENWMSVWQKREGLQDRNIKLSFVHQSKLDGKNTIADVEWWETPGTANIRFAYPAELETVFGDTPAEARDEARRIVIHELLHLVIGGLGSGKGAAWRRLIWMTWI